MRVAGIQYVSIGSHDVAKSVEFYGWLGLTVVTTRPDLGCISYLDAHGVTAFRAPHAPGAGHQAFVNDPSGNIVELNQPESSL